MDVITDFPERLQKGIPVFVGRHHRPAVIEESRILGASMLVKLRDIDTPEAARALGNEPVFVRAVDRPALEPGRYYHHQLVGCQVVDEKDQLLGKLTEILQTGANDVYIVEQADGKELLVPALETVILLVDIQKRIMRVRLPEGLEGDAGN